LQGEIASIHQMFPDLKDVVRPQAAAQSTDEDSTQQASAAGTESESAPRRRRRKRGWSPAQRKAAAERMKAYWAKRKRA
jgi:hypothetical protein